MKAHIEPVGGAITVVDQAMTWSPENSALSSGRAKARWFIVWPGVARATSVKPSPARTSPSVSTRSGAKSRSLEAATAASSASRGGRAGA